MGNSIDKYSKNDPIFKAEFSEYIQNLKLENQDEHDNLYKTISSLRDQLDESKFALKNNVQEAISSKNDEINQLKKTPKNLLNLNFNEESWVEIYSADPSDYFQVVYKLFYENETYQLKVESPLVVVVGNASGVVGTFNDLPLDFSANANRLDVSVIRLSNG